MADRIVDWLQDLSRYVPLVWNRTMTTRRRHGVDYSKPCHHDRGRQLVELLHPRRMQLEIHRIIRETPTTSTLVLKRLDGQIPPHRAGQFVNLFVTIGSTRTSRPYSIVSAPNSEMLELTIRKKDGGFVSPYLCEAVKVGTRLESTGPVGDFCYEPLIHSKDIVMIAGGSGITPFMSMLRHKERHHQDDLKVHLLYGNVTPSDVIFGEELRRMGQELPNFFWDLIVSVPPANYNGLTGFIDADLIKGRIGSVAGKTFFICGPKAMDELVTKALIMLGVPPHKIRRESFGPPPDVTKEPGWPEGLPPEEVFTVNVEGMKIIQAVAGEPLMNSLERNGIVIPAACRTGHCAACQTKVLMGRFFMPSCAELRESDQMNSYVHACVTYPVDDLIIRVARER